MYHFIALSPHLLNDISLSLLCDKNTGLQSYIVNCYGNNIIQMIVL